MFKTVKSKLTLLFTGSLLIILALFILTLYLFIPGAIKNSELDELAKFYHEEEHEWIEELFEDHYEDIEFKPDRNIFYYLFNQHGQLIKGEETTKQLFHYIKNHELQKTPEGYNKELEWKNSHLLLSHHTIKRGEQTLGSVIVGKDITTEKHLIKNIIWILILLSALFSVLFAWTGYFFADQAIKPIQKAYTKQKKFVSDASHELRTPLSIFYSSLEVIDKEKENLSPFGQNVLEEAKKEAELMNKLLNDLLVLARSDQHHFELELQDVNLSLLTDDLLKRFSRILPSSLTIESMIENEIMMKGDRDRLQQLLYILLDNASHYTKEGTITCTVKTIGKKIVVSIKDTGNGISPDDLPYIFDRFYRGDPSRNRKGAGIGLSIAKTIVEAHGGMITVHSELHKGTEFSINFPRKS
ncbi:ATP-binding protein [Bacillus sp. FJAT-27231]|uniref:sensor histidine kinase n=1 Tax=Bacillus sp. FJAT-27231 TaxID=1679168 RepID=UPI000670BF20|nr:HAMP domain-containing sensor histidine kinase [Bacillus sp. FJAT-27231]KMY55292.1 ATP-binding protein [Bacillus sp. FJAT-27231]